MSVKLKLSAKVVRPVKREQHYATWIDVTVNGSYVGTLVIGPAEHAGAVLSLLNDQRLRRRLVEACEFFYSGYSDDGANSLDDFARHRITLSEGLAAEGTDE